MPLTLHREQLDALYHLRTLTLPDDPTITVDFSPNSAIFWSLWNSGTIHCKPIDTLDHAPLNNFLLSLCRQSIPHRGICNLWKSVWFGNQPLLLETVATEYIESNYSQFLDIYTDGPYTPVSFINQPTVTSWLNSINILGSPILCGSSLLRF